MQKVFLYHIRLWCSLLAGILGYCLAPAHWSGLGRLLSGWNAGVVLFLILCFFWMRKLNAQQMRSRYAEEDPTAPVILLIVIVAALLSLLAIVAFLSTAKQVNHATGAVHLCLAALTVVNSWLLVPTMFTMHYADLYYSEDGSQPPLLFPHTPCPLFGDFIYFSFTIAAACQTADVATSQGPIRNMVTLHTLVSFVFNASILGFAINVSAGLLGSS
ncbi:MAG TPA: DUF1345 domain-containing protein [Steroidobacteraceae bacterium]|nr:DUF1345 domain-containing protein [Steroidobacteraceae bacterium]